MTGWSFDGINGTTTYTQEDASMSELTKRFNTLREGEKFRITAGGPCYQRVMAEETGCFARYVVPDGTLGAKIEFSENTVVMPLPTTDEPPAAS
ncbi:MAG: hypothetical protein HY983_01945 [Candidatus Magasanikbacteria bacterium]|nr:hypothetical protein [Candidatus Magasanikbacteria bacterium]